MKDRRTRSNAWWIYITLGTILGALIIVFAYQNNEEVIVKFLIWETKASLSTTYGIIIGICVIALISFSIGGWLKRIRLQRTIRKQEKQIDELKEQLEAKENIQQSSFGEDPNDFSSE